ncbi:MAG: hypothetical protein AABX47_04680 [Nanoarchaeota archaeon]
MDIKRELIENRILLVIVPSENYNNTILETMRALSGKDACYVTLNKTSDSLKEIFRKKKIPTENILFIDAISKTIKETPATSERCYYVSSPAAMTEISIIINKVLENRFQYILFDSLTSLLVYESKAPVAKFVSSLTNKIRGTKTRAIFFALAVKEQSALISEAGMFADKVIDLSKE